MVNAECRMPNVEWLPMREWANYEFLRSFRHLAFGIRH
jgi:hypothetical protein